MSFSYNICTINYPPDRIFRRISGLIPVLTFPSFSCLACQITFFILSGTSDSVIIEHTKKNIWVLTSSMHHKEITKSHFSLPDHIYHIGHSKGALRNVEHVVKRPSLEHSLKSIQFRLALSLFLHFVIKLTTGYEKTLHWYVWFYSG